MRKFSVVLLFLSAFIILISSAVAIDSGLYSDYEGAKVCSFCHPDQYAKWNNSKHARAYENLINSGEVVEDRCIKCHTLDKESDSLKGVQCEMCHLPGKEHIESENKKGTQKIYWSANLCAKCHIGSFHNQFNEWKDSAHSKSLTAAGGLVLENEKCQKCHIAQIIVSKNFKSKEVSVKLEDAEPINCQTCHDPHGSNYEHQLRLSKVDLCVSCHNPEGIEHGMELRHVQSKMYSGSAMEMAGVRCYECHMMARKTGISALPSTSEHSFNAKAIQCPYCHIDKSEGWARNEIKTVQEKTINKIIKVESLLDEAQNFVTSKNSETYNKAKYDLDFVIADRSRGFHNPQKAEKMLEEAEYLAKEVIGITENTTHATTSTKPTSELNDSDVKVGILPGFKAIIAIVALVVIAGLIMILHRKRNKNHRRN